jgi:hypothetical protein
VLADDAASRAAEDVAYKENVQMYKLLVQLIAVSKIGPTKWSLLHKLSFLEGTDVFGR